MASDMYDMAKHSLAGHEEVPKKELKHVTVRKAKGGHVIEHHHTRPEHHPMEEHVTSGTDGMVDHMMTHMGEPNPGEAEADAGQAGAAAPESSAAPTGNAQMSAMVGGA